MIISETTLPTTAPLTHRPQNASATRLSSRDEAARVLNTLEALCDEGPAGTKIPTHTELMRSMNASERTVLNALTELHRRGRIVRRTGAGTFVADRRAAALVDRTVGNLELEQSIVAVMRPDRSVYDECLNLLYRHAELAGLSLTCKIVGSERDFTSILSTAASPSRYILFGYPVMAPLAEELLATGSRVVIIGTQIDENPPVAPTVRDDQDEGAYLAATSLIELGHRRIAYLSFGGDFDGHPRWRGHQRAISDAIRAGRSAESINVSTPMLNEWLQDPAKAAHFFKAEDAPTAAICWNDIDAIRLIHTLQQVGIRVPDDLSVVGYDNLPEGSRMKPSLTTIDGGIQIQLKTAVRLLSQQRTPLPTQTAIIVPTLVQRESSRSINGDFSK